MAVEYLRISLTDRCNLNCIYCTPMEKSGFLKHEDLLRHEAIARAAAAFVRAGVKKIRLTGGEPLLKKNVLELVRLIKAIPGLEELALTTNGLLLAGLAEGLRSAGLDRVNISVDTLKEETFKKITGSPGFPKVWNGIQTALAADFKKVKLNVVIMKGINDAEIPDFAKLSVDYPLDVRFIELYTTNNRSYKISGTLFTTEETKKRITETLGALAEVPAGRGDGPARLYTLQGAKGRLGFISGRSDYFCGTCDRVRLDCAGKVYPCLFSPATHDLRELLRAGASDAALDDYIKKIFLVKSNYKKDSPSAGHIEMSSIGG